MLRDRVGEVCMRAFAAHNIKTRLWPHLTAEEANEDGWFRFDIRIDLPGRVPLIHYLGWLEGSAGASKAERAI